MKIEYSLQTKTPVIRILRIEHQNKEQKSKICAVVLTKNVSKFMSVHTPIAF